MKQKTRLRLGIALFLLGPTLCWLSWFKVYKSFNFWPDHGDSIIEPMLMGIKNQGLAPIILIGVLMFILGVVFLYSWLENEAIT